MTNRYSLLLALAACVAMPVVSDGQSRQSAGRDAALQPFVPEQLQSSAASIGQVPQASRLNYTAAKPGRTTHSGPELLRAGGPPVNDNCAGAITLTPAATCVPVTGDCFQATQSLAAILCNTFTGTAEDDVWYKFVATATSHTVIVDGSLDFDAVVDLRSGACNGVNIGCADATVEDGIESIVAGGLTIGATYLVRVYDYYAALGTTSTFTICVLVTPAAPPNDECDDATVQSLSVPGSVTASGDNTGATDSEGFGYGTAWEAFTITSCANVTVDYCGTAPVFGNFFVDMASDCPVVTIITNVGFVDCGDGNVIITFSNLAAGTYYVPVLMEPGVAEGAYTMEITATACGAPPANNDCAGAITLAVNSSCITTLGNVSGATQSLAAITCATFLGTANDDVWYQFTATATTATIEVTGSASFDAVVDLRSGVCNGTNIACADATLAGETEVINAVGLTVGATYRIRVYDYLAGVPATTTFTICVYVPAGAPPNDGCGSVAFTPLNAGSTITFTGDNTGATATGDYVTGTTLDDGNAGSVWHAFTTTVCTNVTVEYCGLTPAWGNAWIVLALSCPADNNLIFNTTFNITDCGDGNVTIYYNNLPAGSYYFPVMLDPLLDAVGPYSIDVSATACSGVVPANNDCADAISVDVEAPPDCPANAVTGTTIGATQDGVLPSCDLAGTLLDVWYTFNSLTNTEVTITVDTIPDGVASDYVVVVYQGCGGAEDTCFVTPPDPIVMPVTPGTDYVVRVYSNLAYGAATDFTLCVSADFSTGIEVNTTTDWSVFPNPTDGGFTIAYGGMSGNMLIELVDLAGRIVLAEQVRAVTGGVHRIALSDALAKGTYTLRLSGAQGSTSHRVMVK